MGAANGARDRLERPGEPEDAAGFGDSAAAQSGLLAQKRAGVGQRGGIEMPHDGDNGAGGHHHGHNGGGARERPAGLTKNETMVWDVLDGAGEPLKAYEVLDRLKARGVRAPMTVYRALDGLVGKGFVHKLDALNAFMLCTHDGPHDMQAFLVCDECAGVTEFELEAGAAGFQPILRKSGFDMHAARLEIHGVCQDCAGAAIAP